MYAVSVGVVDSVVMVGEVEVVSEVEVQAGACKQHEEGATSRSHMSVTATVSDARAAVHL